MIDPVKALYRISSADEHWIGSLSPRLKALVTGAIAYHCLIQPGRTLLFRFYMGQKWQYPRLTDTSTLTGDLTEQAGLEPIHTMGVTSAVASKTVFSPHYFAGPDPIIDRNIRDILLTPDDATDDDVEKNSPDLSLKHRFYHFAEVHSPVAFDSALDLNRVRRWHKGLRPLKPTSARDADTINRHETQHPWVDVIPGHADQCAQRAVIVALHWLQPGGAESWGMKTVELVKEAGFLPIVLTDTDSDQPWITRPELEGALVLPLTQPLQDRPGDAPLLRALFEQYQIAGILIHHNQWMYDNLWWVKKYFPKTHVVDSLHIVEYVYCGGYPAESVKHDRWIDLHHVISPQLRHWLVDVHHIDPQKILLAPLAGLTTNGSAEHCKKRRDDGRLTIAFVGRLERQKRPDTFLALAHRLQERDPGRFRFILHGSGSLDSEAATLIKRWDLQGSVVRRSVGVPVSKTYHDADVLVISSANEGITLTTMEALQAGIPVISTNVGSQATIVPSRALMPRSTSAFASHASHALEMLDKNDAYRRQLWQEEDTALSKLATIPSADIVFSRMLKEWSSEDHD